MARKPIHIIHCDRCNKEIGRAEIPPDEGKKDVPAYYRQIIRTDDGGKTTMEERELTHLCDRCKKDVAELDERIFTDSRTRKGKAGDEGDNDNENGGANAGQDAGSA